MGPFAVWTITGKPVASAPEVDVLGGGSLVVVVDCVVDTAVVVVTGVSAVADHDPHPATTSAVAAIAGRILRDKPMLLSLEEPYWMRRDPSSEGSSHTGGKAS
jgi:hypothetical protein